MIISIMWDMFETYSEPSDHRKSFFEIAFSKTFAWKWIKLHFPLLWLYKGNCFLFNCSVFPRVNHTFFIVKEFFKGWKKLRNYAHILAYFREFTSFWQTFKNKKLRPTGSSTFGDILIVIMFDVCFKMTKKTFFKVAVERTLKNSFLWF